MTSDLLHSDVRVQLYLGFLIVLSHLRRNQNDTVSGLWSVNSRTSRILQDCDTFDVTRVYLAEYPFYSVNNHQRVRIIQCTPATNSQLRSIISRLTRILADPHAGNLSGKCLRSISDRTIRQFLIKFDWRNSQIHLLLGSITNNHNLFQSLCILP